MTIEELEAEAIIFLAAAKRYWDAAHKAGIQGAVIWTADTDGFGAIFTRGEYRDQMIYNIEGIGPTRMFGSAKDAH